MAVLCDSPPLLFMYAVYVTDSFHDFMIFTENVLFIYFILNNNNKNKNMWNL